MNNPRDSFIRLEIVGKKGIFNVGGGTLLINSFNFWCCRTFGKLIFELIYKVHWLIHNVEFISPHLDLLNIRNI